MQQPFSCACNCRRVAADIMMIAKSGAVSTITDTAAAADDDDDADPTRQVQQLLS